MKTKKPLSKISPKNSAKISLTSKIKVKTNVLSRTVQNEEVILNLTNGIYFGLNEVGTKIWMLLKEQSPLPKIAELVSKEYKISAKDSEKDLLSLIEALGQKDLIELK